MKVFYNKIQQLHWCYSLQLLELNTLLRENIKSRELASLKTDINFAHVNNQLNETMSILEKETKAKSAMNTLNNELTRQNKLNLALSLIGILLLLSLSYYINIKVIG